MWNLGITEDLIEHSIQVIPSYFRSKDPHWNL